MAPRPALWVGVKSGQILGDEAEYNSWVILEKAAAVREEAGSS